MRPALRRSGRCRASEPRAACAGRRGAPRSSWSASLPFLLLAILVAAQLALAGACALVGGRRGAGRRAGGAGRRATPRRRRAARCRRRCETGAEVDDARGGVAVEVPRAAPAARPAGGRASARRRGWGRVDRRAGPGVGRAGRRAAGAAARRLVAFQLLAAGYALTLADGAAEAGALALASGRPAAEAARDALPGWAADDVEVERRGRPGHRAPAAAVAARRRSPSASPSPAAPRRGRDERGSSGVGRVGPGQPGRRGRGRAGRSPRRSPAPAPSPTGRRCWSSSTRAARRGRPWSPSAAARALEERLAAHLPEAAVASRGALCHLTLPADRGRARSGRRRRWRSSATRSAWCIVPPRLLQAALDGAGLRRRRGAAARRPRPRPGADRARRPRPDRPRRRASRSLKRPLAWVAVAAGAVRGAARPARPGGLPALGCCAARWAARRVSRVERAARRCRWRSAAASR